MDPSNITVLTKSRVVAARKRKAKRDEIPEIVFDDEARRCVTPSQFLIVSTEGQLKIPPPTKIVENFSLVFVRESGSVWRKSRPSGKKGKNESDSKQGNRFVLFN